MKYNILITEPQMVEVEAESEEQAIELIKAQVLVQNPRSIASYVVTQEAVIIEEHKEDDIKQENPA